MEDCNYYNIFIIINKLISVTSCLMVSRPLTKSDNPVHFDSQAVPVLTDIGNQTEWYDIHIQYPVIVSDHIPLCNLKKAVTKHTV